MIRVAIIADDLTGALDTASPFACHGARVFCFTEPDAVSTETVSQADVISVSTNSRHMTPDEAAAAVKATAEKICALSPDIVLKKIDSRLKGNVTVECEAVASVFQLSHLLVVPAAPDVGRYVIKGAVEGAGVATPIPIQPLFASSHCQIEISDVASHQAMQSVVQLFMKERNTLPVCARGFAMALAEVLFPNGIAGDMPLNKPWLVAIGSRDPVTTEQRTILTDGSEFISINAPDGQIETYPTSTQALLLHCSGRQIEDSETVAWRFAEGVQKAIAAGETGTVLCSGGDTAHAVLRALGVNGLQVIGEAAPGLPVTRIRVNGRDIIFISKSGGFGGPTTLLHVFANQQGNSRPKVHERDGPQHSQFQH